MTTDKIKIDRGCPAIVSAVHHVYNASLLSAVPLNHGEKSILNPLKHVTNQSRYVLFRAEIQ